MISDYEFKEKGPTLADVEEMLRPMEIDLEAMFRQLFEDVMMKMMSIVKDGATPIELIGSIEEIFHDDNTIPG